jgi:hypothetical protein
MIHRDGTIIARYPKDDKLIGLNVANTDAFQRALALDGNISGRFTSARLVGRQGRRGQVACALSDPHRGDHRGRRPRSPTGGRRSGCNFLRRRW